jgi:hypothetical protein
VHGGEVDLCQFSHLHEGLADEHAFPAPLWAHHDEVVTSLHPAAQNRKVALDGCGLKHCSLFRTNLLQRELRRQGGESAEHLSLRIQNQCLFLRHGIALPESFEDLADYCVFIAQIVGGEALDAGSDKLLLRFNFCHHGKHLIDLSDQGALHHLIVSHKSLYRQGFKEIPEVLMFLKPLLYQSRDVDVLVVEVNHTHARNRGRRGIEQGISFKNEAGAVGEVDALASRQSEKVVVVKNRIQ